MTTSFRGAAVLCLLVGTAFVQAAESQVDLPPLPHGPGTACLGGVGGVYLLAEPGELTIDVYKRDRNRRGSTTELRAILAGPDRRVIAQAAIPDDGQPRGSGWGPVQRTRLTARVPRKGVYALNVTVSQDRYGEEMVWGFATNCPRYLIETARGHRDQRHEEPIVLADPARPGDVCFRPRRGPFTHRGLGAACERSRSSNCSTPTESCSAKCAVGADGNGHVRHRGRCAPRSCPVAIALAGRSGHDSDRRPDALGQQRPGSRPVLLDDGTRGVFPAAGLPLAVDAVFAHGLRSPRRAIRSRLSCPEQFRPTARRFSWRSNFPPSRGPCRCRRSRLPWAASRRSK